ncbi:hypothetical protein AMATHDRAFT_10341 [Amanita thiersii Skay4041]|uniref:CCHC-type domain-containing protein n=1 Tax=Amanita thiersii Skay4041 TaxID=703135 RepID=A0A2A9N7V2_9AGAR|nr:hypothetical protein AMATHDRAFT_10341 [Amanita thiersii Skay4041]
MPNFNPRNRDGYYSRYPHRDHFDSYSHWNTHCAPTQTQTVTLSDRAFDSILTHQRDMVGMISGIVHQVTDNNPTRDNLALRDRIGGMGRSNLPNAPCGRQHIHNRNRRDDAGRNRVQLDTELDNIHDEGQRTMTNGGNAMAVDEEPAEDFASGWGDVAGDEGIAPQVISESPQQLWLDKLTPLTSKWSRVIEAAHFFEIAHSVANPSGKDGNNGKPKEKAKKENNQCEEKKGNNSNNRQGQKSQNPDNKTGNQRCSPNNNNKGGGNTNTAGVTNQSGKRRLDRKKKEELKAANKWFVCEESGHMARNCPKQNTVSYRGNKPPGKSTFAGNIEAEEMEELPDSFTEATEEILMSLNSLHLISDRRIMDGENWSPFTHDTPITKEMLREYQDDWLWNYYATKWIGTTSIHLRQIDQEVARRTISRPIRMNATELSSAHFETDVFYRKKDNSYPPLGDPLIAKMLHLMEKGAPYPADSGHWKGPVSTKKRFQSKQLDKENYLLRDKWFGLDIVVSTDCLTDALFSPPAKYAQILVDHFHTQCEDVVNRMNNLKIGDKDPWAKNATWNLTFGMCLDEPEQLCDLTRYQRCRVWIVQRDTLSTDKYIMGL